MKYFTSFIIAILILFLLVWGSAQCQIMSHQSRPAAAGGAGEWCSNCTTTPEADVMCGWHDSNDCTTSSTSVGGTNVIEERSPPGTDPIAETGNSLRVDINDNAEDCVWYYYPTEAAHANVYGYFWFRLTEENMNNNNSMGVIQGDNNSTFGTPAFILNVQDSLGAYKMNLTAYTDLPGNETVLSVPAFGLNTWVKVEFELVNSGVVRIRANGGGWVTGVNLFDGTTRPSGYYRFGQVASPRTGDYDIGYLHIDDDTLPTGGTEN